MQAQPQKVVVYRSEGERMRDEALWSEGFITPTIAGDICLVLLVFLGCGLVYKHFKDRR